MSLPEISLALGTVQFGIPYGIAGRREAVPESVVRTILSMAANAGIRVLDTAPTYGEIEARLADLMDDLEFCVVSKIPALQGVRTDREAAAFVKSSIARSTGRLGSRLVTLLFHSEDDLLGPYGEAAWGAAERAVGGSIKLGASCYSPERAIELRRRYPISVVQLPGNALDQRLASPRIADAVNGIEIHVRSVFLQGLLLMPPDEAARRVPAASQVVIQWHAWCARQHLSPLTAALAIARQLPGLRHCVIGVDTPRQLDEILKSWSEARPCAASSLACLSPEVIDPRRWVTS